MTKPYEIRDAIIARLGDITGKYKKVRKTPVPPLQPDQVPALLVFVMDCVGSPDGDGNAGPIAFLQSDTIAISVVRGFDDPEVLEGALDAEVDDIKTRLLTDPYFTQAGPSALWESIATINRRWYFPKSGETYFAELRLEITFRSREVFEPAIVDDFHGVSMTARPLANPNAPLISKHFNPPQ